METIEKLTIDFSHVKVQNIYKLKNERTEEHMMIFVDMVDIIMIDVVVAVDIIVALSVVLLAVIGSFSKCLKAKCFER